MKRNYIKTISAFALIGLLGLGASACGGPTDDDGGDGGQTGTAVYKWAGSEDTTNGKVQLSLPDSLVVRADKPTYFAPYLVKDASENREFVSSGGDALLEAGDQAKLLAYWVPDGFELFASLRTKTGTAVPGSINADGTFTAPAVTEKTEYILTLSAKSTENIAGTKTLTNKNLKKDLNVTVVPKGKIKKDTSAKYTVLTEDQRTEVTARLEEYALEHGLTGIRFQTNGSKVLYRDRVTSPVLEKDAYIPTYGWGIDQYGEITKDLDKETTAAYKRYLHSLLSTSSELGTINYLNSDQNAVSTLYGEMASSYYGKALNEDYTATEDITILARENPIPLNKDKDGLATKWKIKVWVGGTSDDASKGIKKDLCFRTGSSVNAKFDKQLITLDDYLTPFKALATGSIGWYRGNEMAETTQRKQRIVGFSDFYAGSAEATSLPSNEEFSSKVGVSLDKSDNSIVIEFEEGFDEDFAKYYLDGLYANPMNEAFLKAIGNGNAVDGAKVYGTSPEGMTPADTSLSVGPYYLEKYTVKTEVVFKRNELWPMNKDNHGRTMYKIAGKYMKVDSALNTDREEAMKQYENGYTDSVSLQTDEHFEKYGNNPNTKTVLPDGTFGTSFNRMDKALWDHYFGKGGIWYEAVNPDGSLTSGVSVNPIVSNDNYFKALDLGFDRATYADAEHDTIAYEYFQPGQKVNPVTNTFYNDTAEHKEAVKNVYGNAFDDPSKSPAKAVQYMQDAIIEELDAGHFDLGTATNPTDFGFKTSIMNTELYKRIANYQNEYWTAVFNEAVTSYIENGENPLLEDSKPLVSFKVTTEEYSADASGQGALLNSIWSGKGQSQSVFSINGNSLDSIDYLDILSCNKVGGFELSFAVDTNVPSGTIEYDGSYWSYESLWWACNGGASIDADGRGSFLDTSK